MGVRDVLGANPLELARDTLNETSEVLRRRFAGRRRDMYEDNMNSLLRQRVHEVFKTAEVRQRVEVFLPMAGAVNVYKRIVDEVSRPVYAIPPNRKVTPDADAEKYAALMKEMRFNAKMDLAVRLVNAMNHVWLYPRYVERLGKMVLDILTPDMVSIIPDPDDPTRELALMYATGEKWNGSHVWVYWDDAERFRFTSSGMILPFASGLSRFHELGRIPFVPIHRRERWGGYFDFSSGSDLEHGQEAVSLLTALVLKLHKSQGEKQLVIEGDTGNLIQDMIIDSEAGVVLPEGTTIDSLDLRSEATHYTDTIDRLITLVASNYGLNRDRINAKTTSPTDDVGLLERRADTIKVFVDAEHDIFELIKLVSREHTENALSDEAELKHVDFGEIEARMDMMSRLKLWDEMERRGLRNPLDDIKALNPEIATDEAALEEFRENIRIWAERIAEVRALNAPQGQPVTETGQSPEDNGAMGPPARDGQEEDEDEAPQT